ncbi:hypothetical protein [Bradyrhizobium japonicum]|uniref:hypothetical protein n=1 Tax=Bradyrhizobium japonicum TaxID=375 RepID=UPI0033995F2D
MNRKIVALVAAFGLAASGSAWAAWPEDKAIEVVVGFAPGGGTDVMARKLLPFVERTLGGKAKFVVLNKPGAGGEIAFAANRARSARRLFDGRRQRAGLQLPADDAQNPVLHGGNPVGCPGR